MECRGERMECQGECMEHRRLLCVRMSIPMHARVLNLLSQQAALCTRYCFCKGFCTRGKLCRSCRIYHFSLVCCGVMPGMPLALCWWVSSPLPCLGMLVAVSRVHQRCLAVLFWTRSWDFPLLPSSGGFICIIYCCLGRLSRCFCDKLHVSWSWGKSKSWECFYLPA